MTTRQIAFDPVLKRPGCVLIQASYGCVWHDMEMVFPSETWLLHPTDNMGVFEATPEQIKILVAMSLRAIGKKVPKDG